MLPISLLKSVVSVLPSSCLSGTAGHGQKLSLLVVANHGLCQRHSSSVSSTSTKTDLGTADSSSVGKNEETGLVTSEDASLATRGPLPLITKRELEYLPSCRTSRQAWVENLDTVEEKKLGLIDLHPDVFGTFPRLELIKSNLVWQERYKKVNWDWRPTRGEVKGPNSKPWPQKGMGKARHGDRRSPIWIKGGKAHGPRGPKTYFYMLPFYKRVHGLTSTLSVKLAQDDLKIVDTLDIPTNDPKYLEDLASKRHWGISVLFVDDTDVISKNIALATDSIGHMNIMPVYGLNVFSMLKHETLVLTLAAVNKIEEKLIMQLNRHDGNPPTSKKMRHNFA